MQLTEKNLLAFYHYATSLVDAIRPMLNTKNFDNIENPEYWHKSMTEFKTIISNILEDQIEPVEDLEYVRQAHFRIFGNILNANLQLFPNENKSELIVRSNQLAKISLKVLYGIEL